jgi:DNA polymerase
MDFRQKYSDFFEALDDEYMEEERFVPAVGDEGADFVLIGEAPGANEVEEGEPFVGRAGDRLNEALRDIGVDREDVYITNLVKIRPPENRDPTSEEIEAWRPLLMEELESINPETVIPLGNFASKELSGTSKGITSIHGDTFSFNGWKVVPVYHPAATLYDRSKMPEFREDLRKAFGRKDTGQQTLEDL